MVMNANQCGQLQTLLTAFNFNRQAFITAVNDQIAKEAAMDAAEDALDIAVANQANSATLIALAVGALQTYLDSVELPLSSEEVDEAYNLGQVIVTLQQAANDNANTLQVLGANFANAQNAFFASQPVTDVNHAAYVAAWNAFKAFVDANITI